MFDHGIECRLSFLCHLLALEIANILSWQIEQDLT